METSVNNKCRAFTSLEQSKKLAKILPLESSDMVFVHTTDLEGDEHYDIDFRKNQPLFEDDVCAWSLAALLGVLPEIQGGKPVIALDDNYITYPHMSDLHTKADNSVDACYEMIIRLNELNLL
jgi:hypothetical protein